LNVKGTRGHTLKSFSHTTRTVVGRWNSLDQEMVDVPSINAFSGRLDKMRQKLSLVFFMD